MYNYYLNELYNLIINKEFKNMKKEIIKKISLIYKIEIL